ncbi:MAG: histidinol dehydrogenase [Deltaproteobacteria bacterium]|nr:histidinol dehydrogenase [Deltaproteobacteria bacterium]
MTLLAIHAKGEPGYDAALRTLDARGETDLGAVEPAVRAILEEVRARGDDALRELTARFESRALGPIVLDDATWRGLARSVEPRVRDDLVAAAARIERYHRRQIDVGFAFEDDDGARLGLRILPLDAAGVYAPGGKARYPSSVLMAAVPARVAGVVRIVLATPSPTAEVLAAAEVAGVTEVVDLGGAQAIAALAFGTGSVVPVSVIVGPGNLYVACAKKLVSGRVAIDGIAGPSEILVVADDRASPELVAADLLSQAEHDEAAYPLLACVSRAFAERVAEAVEEQLATLPRRAIAEASVRAHGVALVCGSIDEALEVADRIAPEHLALEVADPDAVLPQVGAAGAIFLGDHTPEAVGDYVAGPSHVLPTGGAARHTPPLGVWHFVRRSSVIAYDRRTLLAHGPLIERLARMEGLEAHARAVSLRTKTRPT